MQFLTYFILLSIPMFSVVFQAGAQDYGVASWPADLGNHRAIVSVDHDASAVIVHLPWRRHDAQPEQKDVLVMDLSSGKFIRNVAKLNLSQETGDIAFEPVTVPGDYAIYYYPLQLRPNRPTGSTNFQYAEPMDSADEQWLRQNGLNADRYFEGNAYAHLPRASLSRFEARSEHDRFDPMELPATSNELKRLMRFNADRAFMLFPEDRQFPIRMREHLPVRWAKRGPTDRFEARADRGEYYPFQIGVYAATQSVEHLQISCSELRNSSNATIPAKSISCITLNGYNALGEAFVQDVSVPQGQVRGLWFVVNVPQDIPAGVYTGVVTIGPENGPQQKIDIVLDVQENILADGGVSDLNKLSRLAWLNSRMGQQDEVTAPYSPLVLEGQTIHSSGKTVTIADNGLPEQVRVAGQEVLSSPITLSATTANNYPIKWRDSQLEITHSQATNIAWRGVSSSAALDVIVNGQMSYDGYVFLAIQLEAKDSVRLANVKLQIPYRKECAEYFMGFGQGRGGYRPDKDIDWQWSNKPTNKVWMGNVEAGLQIKLRGPAEHQEVWSNHLPEEAGIPESWDNNGSGGAQVKSIRNMVMVTAFTGAINMKANDHRQLCVSLVPTPVKPRDPEHWTQADRWAARPSMLTSVSMQQAIDLGANDTTAFHNTPVNPWINYPFLEDERLKKYVADAHAVGMTARLYYTVRELTNHAAEFWPLWSMREEFFMQGSGGGGPWLQEHLQNDYAPAWTCTPDGVQGTEDQSILLSGMNRWHNYYIESVAWLTTKRQVDGLYFDGVTFGRRTLQRLRRVGDATRPDFMMDFHCGNTITRRSNTYNDFLELLPYLDRTWIGEGFNYDYSPDFYMVELSGIPFGVPNDMLQYGGNPWRGMVYGMTSRYVENHSGSPTSMWQFWDDIGIKSARMIGYWDVKCPVRTNREDVLATVYKMDGKALIAVASWAKEDTNCQLDIDYAALGLNPETTHAFAPDIPEFQSSHVFDLSQGISVSSGRGWLIVLSEKQPSEQISPLQVVDQIKLDKQEIQAHWELHQPQFSDGQIQCEDDAIVVSGSRNTFVYLQRDLPSDITAVACQMQLPDLKVNRQWHDRHDGMNAPGLAVKFAGGDTVRVSFASQGVVTIEDNIMDHMYKPVLQFRNQEPNDWSWVRINWSGSNVMVECSTDGKTWECVRAIPRNVLGGPATVLKIGKLSKDYGWPRSVKIENTGGRHTGIFRELQFLKLP